MPYTAAGRNFTFYGYQFEAPWTDVKREVHLKNMELVYFSNNLFMKVNDPAQTVNQLKVLTREGTKDEAALKRLFGKETTRSNYTLRSKILNLTPVIYIYLSQAKKWSQVRFS